MMARHTFVYLVVLSALAGAVLPDPTATPSPEPAAGSELRSEDEGDDPAAEEPPEGYYAFVESPNATPPRVRPPPYRQVASPCPEADASKPHVSAHNLCGDLNRGVIPQNPMGQSPNGEPYPFELIRNHTLRFLSRTLPVLRADDTLPRVAHVAQVRPQPPTDVTHNGLEERVRRSAEDQPPAEHRSAEGDAPREAKKFCDGGGVFCMLYRAINGESETPASLERREDPGAPHVPAPHPAHHRYEGPPTPCPARVEYATPVFARNYQGVWRYVVQIPYEGYFTQTVEVTRCMQSRCHYLDGGCLSSPRWVSLLVAEMHYPPAPQPPTQSNPEYGQFTASTGPAETADKPPHCDGHDELGCYQVRLYYDWFLVPGSCKCWRPDYFARYVRRRQTNEL